MHHLSVIHLFVSDCVSVSVSVSVRLSACMCIGLYGFISSPHPPQARLEAMQCLLQFPSGDLVTSESWTPLRVAISNALMDDDATIAVSRPSKADRQVATYMYVVSLVLLPCQTCQACVIQ